jgi:hypothetical protein
MASTSFTIITTQFTIYVGFPICIFGLINLRLLFPTRSNACSFLLFVSSFFNIIALAEGLLPRILAIAFNIDASTTSMIWCKSRFFLINIVTIASQTCLCFASVDRFLMSCRSVAWRNRSKLSAAKIATFIAILVIIASNVPFLFSFTIIEVKTGRGNTTTICALISPDLVIYVNYIIRPVLLGILPCAVLGITGWLTYRNIKSITSIQYHGTFQRSLTSMILLQIITVIIPIIPFATINVYQVATSSIVKTSYRLAQETLAFNITNIILYISCASNFYIYLISASSYRRDFLRLVLFWHSKNNWDNRIETVTRDQLRMRTASMVEQLPRSVNQTEQRTNF